MGKCIELTGRNLSASDVCNIARGLCKVSVSTEAIERLVESRKLVFELSDKGVPIYGCNRGVGWNKDKKVTKEFVSQFNKNMLHSHSVGVGESASIEEARGAMVIRLNNLLVGCTGLSPEIVQLMAEMLNRIITPLFPKRGSVGEADIVNLSHLGLVLIGEGKVLYKGAVVLAAEAFAKEGLEPVVLLEKDGLAILSSNALSAAMACEAYHETEVLMHTADMISCMSLEGLNGNVSPLRDGAQRQRPYPRQIETAAALRSYLEGSYLYEPSEGRPLQDPLSFRCVSQVHGAVRTAMDYARENLEIHLNASDDNPCLLLDERDITSCGNFDPLVWVLGMQNLSVALSHVSKMSCLRSLKLAMPGFTGLTRHLTPNDDTIAFSTIQKTYASMDAEIRLLANPVSMDTFPLAGGMEDISTNAPLVMEKHMKIIDDLYYVLAVEGIHAAQAMNLRGAHYGKGTQAALKRLRGVVPFYSSDDRVLTDDIEAIHDFLKGGGLLADQ